MKRMDKRCSFEERDFQLRWFSSLDCGCVPSGLRPSDHGYSYDFVEGACPVDPSRIDALLQFCASELWYAGTGPLLVMKPRDYFGYVADVACTVGIDRRCMDWVFSHSKKCWFTPVRACHGDLTLENVVDVGTGFVFIDPGRDRGLPCKELDEAKTVQWMEEIDAAPLPLTLERCVLLVTHYMRLLRHSAKHSSARCAHAARRIEQLTFSRITCLTS